MSKMIRQSLLLWSFLLVLCQLDGVTPTRTKDRIYSSIDGTAACFRRMNGTHQFGCSSHRTGNVGVLEVIDSADDLQWLLDNGPLPPYMPVLHMEMFTKAVMMSLKDSGKVSGVVLLKNTTRTVSTFSHEDTCPNRYSGLSSYLTQQCTDSNAWNPEGTALLMVDWGFPIFYVHNRTSIDKILDCHKKYNSDRVDQQYRSMCAMEMNSYMFAAKDSETCIRRSNMVTNLNPVKHCDPLGGRSIWSTIFPRSNTEAEPNKSTIVLAARLDSTSLFDGEMPGAGSAVAGLVTVLATSQMLAALRKDMEPLREKRNILISLLNGEAYDYIGSSRMLYDMKGGRFPPKAANLPPLNYTSFRLFVELNQVTNLNENGTIYFHSTPQVNQVTPADEVTTFITLMQQQAAAVKVNMVTSKGSTLPPASLQTFVKQDSSMQGVVLADHDTQYVNKFYHSILDDAELIKFKYMNGSEIPEGSIQRHIAGLSTALARTVYQMTTNQKYTGNVTVDPTLVDELLQCYLVNMNCRMFQSATSSAEKLPSYPPSMYIGVSVGPSYLASYTGQTLALLTGTKTNLTKKECKTNHTDLTYQHIWMRGSPEALDNSSVCMQTTMNYSEAVSPAFTITDYQWTSGLYSTWTESVWREFTVRIFLKPSKQHEAMVLSIGCITLLLSFPIVWFIVSRSDILLNTNTLNGGC